MSQSSRRYFLVAGVCVSILTGCGGGSGSASTTSTTPTATAEPLRVLLAANSIKSDPIELIPASLPIPDLAAPLPQLGKMLFFSKTMSGNRDVACVSCHHVTMGGGDNLMLPIGVDPNNPEILGPGRLRVNTGTGQTPAFGIGDAAMPRNSPTVFGLAFWDKAITWDGTVTSAGGIIGSSGTDSLIVAPLDTSPVTGMLTHPSLAALTTISYAEKFDTGMSISAGHGMFPSAVKPAMRGSIFNGLNPDTGLSYTDLDIRKAIAKRFASSTEWVGLFRTAFNDATTAPEALVTANNVSKAIASYERTMTFSETPWKKYVKGTGEISDATKRGALLFFKSASDGGANCASCHSGPFFTNEKFFVLAVPQVGRGKADKNSETDTNDDWGRGHVTGDVADKYAYRVPTLLNVEVTGPYGHDGVFPTLEGIIRHHLNVETSVNSFDYTNLSTAAGPTNTTNAAAHTALALATLKAQRVAGQDVIKDIALTDQNISDIVEFMKALTDPCTKDKTCLSKWVPQQAEYTQYQSTLSLLCPKDKDLNPLISGTCN